MRSMIVLSCLFLALMVVNAQNVPVNTPNFMRGLWCIAEWTETTQTYKQLGQAFFYNNNTFSLNYLTDMSFTWSSYFVSINNTDSSTNTYQIHTFTTRGLPPYLNRTSCFWQRLLPNGDIVFGRQINGTCTPNFENETTSTSIRYTRNSNNCLYVDDDNPSVILSNTQFEVNTLLPYDRVLPTTKRKAVVFYGSSSIVRWDTLVQDFPDYLVLNRGFGGSLLAECSKEFKRIVYPLEPSVIVIYAGENDIAAGQTAIGLQAIFRQFIPLLRHYYPTTPVAYISLKPSILREDKMPQMNDANQRIRNDIQLLFPGVTFIDIWSSMLLPDGKPNPDLFEPDKLHMNAKGYAIWTKAVTIFLESIF